MRGSQRERRIFGQKQQPVGFPGTYQRLSERKCGKNPKAKELENTVARPSERW